MLTIIPRRLFIAFTVALLGWSCAQEQSTQVLVLMDTDYAVPTEVDRIRAVVSRVVEEGSDETEVETWRRVFDFSNDASDDSGGQTLPATFGILPNGSSLDQPIVIELEALARGSDQVVVSRRARTGFVPGEARLIRMVLYRACEDVRCSSGETCGCAGASSCAVPSCVDESVPPSDLETIDDPGALPPDAGIPIDPGGPPDGGVPPNDGGADGGIMDGGVDCEPPLTLCGSDCANTRTDPRYCGDCETACSSGFDCMAGECMNPDDCRRDDVVCMGFTYCDAATGDCVPGCIDTQQCTGEGEICDLEAHACVCPEALESCDGDCVDTQQDPEFCGGCTRSCNDGQVCDAGMCLDLGDCRSNGIGCTGFTYCDAATGDCLRGCSENEQCTGPNEVCDLDAHECVCDELFEPCGGQCCRVGCPPGEVLLDGTCARVHVQVADGSGDVGEYTSIALDASGAPHVGHYARSGKNLEYSTRRDDGSWFAERPDMAGDVGKYASLAFDDASRAHCAYYEEGDEDLRVAVRQFSGSWTVQTVDAENDVGEYASLSFDSAGVAHISYHDKTDADLMYATRESNGSWSVQTIDSKDDVGEYTSLAFDPAGVAHVSFYDKTNEALMYATEEPDGSWTVQAVDSDGKVGKYTSLAFDTAGVAHISYYDEDNKDLRHAVALDSESWAIETVDAADDVGKYTSLAVDGAGTVRISYFDETARDLKYAVGRPGVGWTTETIDTVGDVGRYTSIAVDALGHAHVSYRDATNKTLKYVLIAAPE